MKKLIALTFLLSFGFVQVAPVFANPSSVVIEKSEDDKNKKAKKKKKTKKKTECCAEAKSCSGAEKKAKK